MVPPVRLIVCDFYLAAPRVGLDPTYSEFRGAAISHVPVLRLFGSTLTGAKVCLHVHGVFPYFYIPFDGNENPNQLQYAIANALDKALDITLGQTNATSRHVFKIVLVSGIPFYGFHDKEHQYFKIYLYNPNLIKKAADLLLNGSVLGRVFQPHEAHLPYTMQFMIEYNVQGMHLVHCSNMVFRRDPQYQVNEPADRQALEIPFKASSCEIEADVMATDILNRLDNYCSSQEVVNPGLAALWADENQRRRDQGRTTQPTPLASQQRNPSGLSTGEEFHRCRLNERLVDVGEESICSSQTSSFSYPAEAPDGLMNASFVEQHCSCQSNDTITPEPDPFMDTQDKELLDLLEEMENTQIENADENNQEVEPEEQEEDSAEETEIRETLEMTQPFVGNIVPLSNSSDEDSFEELFSSPESLQNLDERLNQIDGTDDKSLQKPRRRRLGTRGSVQTERSMCDGGTRDTSEEGWLMQEIGQVLELPNEALEQLQMGLMKDLLATPEANGAVQLLEEERQTTENPADNEHAIQESSGIAGEQEKTDLCTNKDSSTEDVAVSTVKETRSNEQETEPNAKEDELKPNKLHSKKRRVYRCQKTLGALQNRKRVSVEVRLPGEVAVDKGSIKITGQNQKLNISFEVESPQPQEDTRTDAEKIKPCFVRLDKIKLPKNCIQEVPRQQEGAEVDSAIKKGVDSEEEMEPLVLLSSDDDSCVAGSPVKTELNSDYDSSQNGALTDFSPKKRKRLSLSLGSPMSPKDAKKKRRERRKSNAKFKGLSVGELQLLLSGHQLKNEKRHPRKGPDKILSDESADDSGLKSFYDLTVPPVDEFLIEPLLAPPSELKLAEFGLQPQTFQPPFYSDPKDGDVPLSSAPCHLPPFHSQWFTPNLLTFENSEKRSVLIEPILPPPRADQLVKVDMEVSRMEVAEVENLQQARAVVEENHLTVMHLEMLAVSRGKLLPDPEFDPICSIYFLIHGDQGPSSSMGIIAVKQADCPPCSLLSPDYREKCQLLEVVPNESEALSKLIHVVKLHNPDILMGYEIEMESWGYLVQRAARLGLNLPNLLSRVPKSESHEARQAQSSQGTIAEYSDLKIPGRIVLNLWRLLRHEIALQNYSLESVSFHLLHRRLPQHSTSQLLAWWADPRRCFLLTDYQLSRLSACHQLLDSLDLLGRTSELARLFGIQFSEVFSRGSQFRVESMMLRLAKPKNFVAVSPSVAQRALMRSPEFIPLVMEPQSAFYEDPVAVLDFQSLYPSVIIGHNLCFSTCLGRVELLGKEEPFEFGASFLKVDPCKIKKLEPYVSPNGVAFVPKTVRKGILPSMLAEILDTRLMVKQAMKHNKNDETLAKVLHARQLGLKLIANVTYGYTAANFSGRMPCAEVADAVVSKGREILERAIRMVNDNKESWGGEVVYGDTDSMFVLFRGKTKQEAFDLAEQIAEAVTRDNPSPIKLKMEKIYQPCILQTKKRYVGFMYENKKQEEPIYEAKGIETVRRDGCPAVSKLLEKCLRILFSTKDLSQVKKHTVNYFQQVLLGTVSLQDFIFAKEFRGFAGYRPGACVPALELARQWVRVDRRAEPRRSQRVPYVIVSGAPGLPLIRLVRCPTQLLEDAALRLNAEYYLSRALVPPLARCFNLLGVDVAAWLAAMPRRTVVGPTGRGSIAHFFGSIECQVCRNPTRKGLCEDCKKQPQMAAFKLAEMVRVKERARQSIEALCSSCCGRQFDLECGSLACPVMYRRKRELLDDQLPKLRQCLQDLSF